MGLLGKIAAVILFSLSSFAHAECYVTVQVCLPGGIKAKTTFLDSDPLARISPNRCLKRARDYFNWCGAKLQTVDSIFFLDDVPTVGVSVKASSSTLFAVSAKGNTDYFPTVNTTPAAANPATYVVTEGPYYFYSGNTTAIFQDTNTGLVRIYWNGNAMTPNNDFVAYPGAGYVNGGYTYFMGDEVAPGAHAVYRQYLTSDPNAQGAVLAQTQSCAGGGCAGSSIGDANAVGVAMDPYGWNKEQAAAAAAAKAVTTPATKTTLQTSIMTTASGGSGGGAKAQTAGKTAVILVADAGDTNYASLLSPQGQTVYRILSQDFDATSLPGTQPDGSVYIVTPDTGGYDFVQIDKDGKEGRVGFVKAGASIPPQ